MKRVLFHHLALDNPPITAEKYFEKLYTDKNQINLAAPLNSTTGALLGFNFNDYSEFSQNSRLKVDYQEH